MAAAYESDDETRAAVDRLRGKLPSLAPDIWATLNPPANDNDIRELELAVRPITLPGSLVTWLRFADGQTPTGSARAQGWPSIVGPGWLLGARRMVEEHLFWRESTPPGLLRIANDSGSTVQIELVRFRTPILLGNFHDYDELDVVAPSLGAMLSAAVDVAQAGLLDREGVMGEDYDAMVEHRSQIQTLLDLVYLDRGWGTSPFAPAQNLSEDEFLNDWRFPSAT